MNLVCTSLSYGMFEGIIQSDCTLCDVIGVVIGSVNVSCLDIDVFLEVVADRGKYVEE